MRRQAISEHVAFAESDQTYLAAQAEPARGLDTRTYLDHQCEDIIGATAVVGLDEVGMLVGHHRAAHSVPAQPGGVECPKLMQAVRDALVDKDAALLTRAAHSLKNNADLFGAKRAFDAAWTLEKLGREPDFEQAARTWEILEQELVKTNAAMANFET